MCGLHAVPGGPPSLGAPKRPAPKGEDGDSSVESAPKRGRGDYIKTGRGGGGTAEHESAHPDCSVLFMCEFFEAHGLSKTQLSADSLHAMVGDAWRDGELEEIVTV